HRQTVQQCGKDRRVRGEGVTQARGAAFDGLPSEGEFLTEEQATHEVVELYGDRLVESEPIHGRLERFGGRCLAHIHGGHALRGHTCPSRQDVEDPKSHRRDDGEQQQPRTEASKDVVQHRDRWWEHTRGSPWVLPPPSPALSY